MDLAAMGKELEGHFWEAIECKNANHVFQKYIARMRPRYVQFIIDELMSWPYGVWYAARHPFGCRIILRLLEHGSQEQVQALVAQICSSIWDLCAHRYANHVVRRLLESGRSEDHVAVARALVGNREIIFYMAGSDYGWKAVMQFLQLSCDEAEIARRWLLEGFQIRGRLSRYEKVIAKCIGLQLHEGMQDGFDVQQVKREEEEEEKVDAQLQDEHEQEEQNEQQKQAVQLDGLALDFRSASTARSVCDEYGFDFDLDIDFTLALIELVEGDPEPVFFYQ